MPYDIALEKAWQELARVTQAKRHAVRFLDNDYDIDSDKKSVHARGCDGPAKDYIVILILHYLARKLKGLPPVKGEWIAFNELTGGQGYYPTFKKRVIDVIMRKYRAKPDTILDLTGRFSARKAQLADIGVILEPFNGVPLLITFWRQDEEFDAEANVLFDKSIKDIFCTEDITVLAETLAHTI